MVIYIGICHCRIGLQDSSPVADSGIVVEVAELNMLLLPGKQKHW